MQVSRKVVLSEHSMMRRIRFVPHVQLDVLLVMKMGRALRNVMQVVRIVLRILICVLVVPKVRFYTGVTIMIMIIILE